MLIEELHQLEQLCLQKKLVLVTAESCTGGGVAYAITSIAGSSRWFDRGFVTYSNTSKQEMLGVEANTIEKCGAVSEEVAIEMAIGALNHSQADISLAITGIAGPEGGSPQKPVGTCYFAWGGSVFDSLSELQCFAGDRHAIRSQAIQFSLAKLITLIAKHY